ncbi:TIGR02221 family CRISPR-associated protein [Methanocaldococcus fervens]|uniref:CRISPR-associated protein, TM1812 family n=1 Tax=Methanocaldococcus fervens (strain DSM 4213 / JCM 15782 / AG86) TaxID=573064 RepID=C7P8A0_METFA|nr:CRISPR-associated protein, TM1812 family [Methanocaldococcus fervens AG86]
MAKILIFPLGVGDTNENIYKRTYIPIKYRIGNKEIEDRFIISVLIDYLKVDKVIIVGTSRSMWENLYKHYAELVNEFDEEYWRNIGEKVGKSENESCYISEDDLKKIEEVIDKYLKKINPNATGGSKCKIIKYGSNENEILENFDIFMGMIEEINEGDEIYLDITHSFRSIPLFMYLMLEFVQYLKKDVRLKGLYYGMLDAYKRNYATIVDLSPLFEISYWIKGMYDFTNYGNNYLISKLLEKKIKI